MQDSIMLKRAFELSVKTVKLCKRIREDYKDYVLSEQLVKSGTSVGANIYESKYAQSTADFVSKMQIALKECFETEYWLKLLCETDYISKQECDSLLNEYGAIRRMLISSINTVKENNK